MYQDVRFVLGYKLDKLVGYVATTITRDLEKQNHVRPSHGIMTASNPKLLTNSMML